MARSLYRLLLLFLIWPCAAFAAPAALYDGLPFGPRHLLAGIAGVMLVVLMVARFCLTDADDEAKNEAKRQEDSADSGDSAA
jgi:hypothetical protein